MRDALAPVFARRGDPAEIERLRRVRLAPRDVDVRPQVLAEVRQVLVERPDLTTNAVCRCVPRHRQEVQEAVRILRNGREPVPVDEERAS
jgi:hypothetical protein